MYLWCGYTALLRALLFVLVLFGSPCGRRQAEGRLGELVDVSLNRFTSHATAQRDTIMGAVESAAAGLEGRVNKRLSEYLLFLRFVYLH